MSADQDAAVPELSRREQSRSLRAFMGASAIWGVFGAGLGASFLPAIIRVTGFPREKLGVFTAVNFVAGVCQFLAHPLMRRFRDRRTYVLLAGAVEVVFVPLIYLAPLFVPSVFAPGSQTLLSFMFLTFIMGRIGMGLVIPAFLAWWTAVVPERTRSMQISRRMAYSQGVTMLANGILAWIYAVPDSQLKHLLPILFPVVAVSGILGYVVLRRATWHAESGGGREHGSWRAFIAPMRDRPFVIFVLYACFFCFGTGLSVPYYFSYLQEELRLSVGVTTVIQNFAIAGTILGALVLGKMADRSGARPARALGLIPTASVPVLLILSYGTAGMSFAARFLAAAGIWVILGLGSASSMVAGSSLAQKLAPRGERSAPYFALLSASAATMSAIGGLSGSWLLGVLDHGVLRRVGHAYGGVEILFLITFSVVLSSMLVLLRVPEERAVKTRTLLWNMGRGRPLQFAWGSVALWASRSERGSADAIDTIAGSRSPMAVDTLIDALDHPQLRVRSRAARALGDIGDAAAADALASHLEDEESDIRGEAAEALGAIRAPEGIDRLLRALASADRRVATSAMLALAGIGGPEVVERLRAELDEVFDRATFPTLVGCLARLGVRDVAPRTVAGLAHLRRTAIRLQVLMAAARMLGIGDRYGRTLAMDPIRAAGWAEAEVAKAQQRVRSARLIDSADRDAAAAGLDALADGVAREDAQAVVSGAADVARALVEHVGSVDRGKLDDIFLVADTIVQYGEAAGDDVSLREAEGFLVVAVARLVGLTTKRRPAR